jgi:hypothetical protein
MSNKEKIMTSLKIWFFTSILGGLIMAVFSIFIIGPMAFVVFLMISVYGLIFSVTSIPLLFLTFKLIDKIINYKKVVLTLAAGIIAITQFVIFQKIMNKDSDIIELIFGYSENIMTLIVYIITAIITTLVLTRKNTTI